MPEALQAGFRRAFVKRIDRQRVWAEKEEEIARQALLDAGCETIELSPEERQGVIDVLKPLHEEARGLFGEEMWRYLSE